MSTRRRAARLGLLLATTTGAAACGAARRPHRAPAAAPADTVAHGPALLDPSTAVRFEIVAVGDTTLDFLTPRAPWLQVGATGIAVDPRRRDALVARFQVYNRRGDTTQAVVTGQTMKVSTDHVALVGRPETTVRDTVHVTRRASFWWGAATGAVIGLVAGLLAR